MSEQSNDPAAVPRVCGNCGTAMLGDHCYRCGQPVKGLVRHFGSIIGDFLDSVFDFDSRTVRTLGPLFYRPGYLSNEYIAGRRVRYVSPVRLFVFLCILSFFVLQLWLDPDLNGAVQIGNHGDFATLEDRAAVERRRDELVADLQAGREQLAGNPAGQAGMDAGITAVQAAAQRRIEELHQRASPGAPPVKVRGNLDFGNGPWDAQTNPVRIASMPEAFNEWLNGLVGRVESNLEKVRAEPRLLAETFMQTLPQTFFVLLPLFALLLKLVYLFKRRLYMEHLIVALHSHAFLCISLLLIVALDALRALLQPGLLHSMLTGAERLVVVWMPLYLLIALKRVYRQSWIPTLLKFAVLGVAYLVLLAVAAVFNLAFNLVWM